MADKRILSVGNCAADHASITWTLGRNLPAEIVAAATAQDALTRLEQERFDLVLVNRIFDRDGGSGLDLITQLVQRGGSPPVMLVSNYPDAQNEAARLGALRGFGKSALADEDTLTLVRSVLDTPDSRQAT